MEREREMLVGVDQDTCIGCGQCAAFAPEVFGFSSSGNVPAKVFVDGALEPEGVVSVSVSVKAKVIRAERECPAAAITVEEVQLLAVED